MTTSTTKQNSTARRGRMAMTLALVVIILGLLGLAQTESGHGELVKLGLQEHATPYTELSFVDPNSLPAVASASVVPLTPAFVIHNVTGEPRIYRWSIESDSPGSVNTLASGQIELQPAGSARLDRLVVVQCPASRIHIDVRLKDLPVSIGFWMTCPTSAQSRS